MAERSKALQLSCRGLAGRGFESRWRHIFFILNFSLPPRSEQVNGAVANEIKHVHSPEVIVVLDHRYDLSYKALYITTCSIALNVNCDWDNKEATDTRDLKCLLVIGKRGGSQL